MGVNVQLWQKLNLTATASKSKLVQSLKGIKAQILATLEQSLKICIQGQFFVLKKTRWGTRLIF